MSDHEGYSQETLVWLDENVLVPDRHPKDRHYWRRAYARVGRYGATWRCLKCGITTTKQHAEDDFRCKVAEQQFT